MVSTCGLTVPRYWNRVGNSDWRKLLNSFVPQPSWMTIPESSFGLASTANPAEAHGARGVEPMVGKLNLSRF